MYKSGVKTLCRHTNLCATAMFSPAAALFLLNENDREVCFAQNQQIEFVQPDKSAKALHAIGSLKRIKCGGDNMTKLFSIILAAVVLTACQQVPQNVKNKQSSNPKDSIQETDLDLTAERADISQLDDYSEKLGDFIDQNGWDKKFKLKDGLKVGSAKELYNIKLKQVENSCELFPKIYKYCFNSDFEKDSGISDINKLTSVDTDHLIPGFKNVTSITDYVMYDDSKTFSNETKQSDDHLTVGMTGFIYFTKGGDYRWNELTDIINYDEGQSLDKKFDMFDGTQCSPDEAKVYAEKYINELFAIENDEFNYTVSLIKAARMPQGGYVFEMALRKTYKGVPMTDFYVDEYTDSKYTKPMAYYCNMSGKENVVMADSPYAFEKVQQCEKITDKVIPVTAALRNVEKKLAPEIKLDISEVKLMYYNEYDGSNNIKANGKLEDGAKPTELSIDEQLELMYPYWVSGREYTCYPVWAFYMPKSTATPETKDELQSTRLYDYIFVNALTGEFVDFIDRGSSH